jgi:perosamine synthetase
LERHAKFLKRRLEIFALYRKLLDGIEGIGFRPIAQWATLSPWLFSITVDPDEFGQTRDELMATLAEHKIDSRPFFVPVHKLPPFREEAERRKTHLPLTDRLCDCGVNLPTYATMTGDQVERIAMVIRSMVR